MTIRQMLVKLRSIELERALPGIVQQTSYEIEALNKQQLYNYGVDANGNKLDPKYKSKYYAKEKSYQNNRPGLFSPDLYLTGAFYKGFTVSISGDIYKVDSTDGKSDDLKKRYGNEIFGLTRDNRKVYAMGVLYTAIQKYVTLKTGLEFR